MSIPTRDQVAQIPASLAVVAPPEFEDYNGHVNVSHHYALHMEACERALSDLGMTLERIAAEGVTVFSAEHHLTFLNEIRIGDLIEGHVRWIGRTPKILHGVSILVNGTTGDLASLCEFVEISIDLNARRSTEFPADLATAFDAATADHATLDWTVPLAGPMGTNRAG